MRSVNQKIFFINLIVVLAALIVWRATSTIEIAEISSRASSNSHEIKNSLFLGFGVLLVLVILVQIYLHRTITRPLRLLAKDLKIRARSGLLDPVAVNGHDEIAQLADLFNVLQKKIKHQVNDLKCFADNVCHEIRTPLASIVTSIEYMDRKQSYNRDLALVIKSEAVRLGDIASALLESTSHIGILSKSYCCVEEIFQQAVTANGLSDRVKVSFTGALKQVLIDPVLIRQVFENILANAKKFAFKDSTIKANFSFPEATNERNPRSLIFSLANEGACVPETQIKRVFDRFYSVNVSNDVKGYGIGLSLCREIIESHGGSIKMENLATGGVVVFFDIPR
jgi:K+-sensing histidine kinase KdpD